MKNNMKKLRGMHSKFDDFNDNPLLAALANPDILSEEDGMMFPERDFDAEEARAAYIEKFTLALATLTPKQRAIVDALARHGDQAKVCAELGVAQSTVANTLRQIQKKISKSINKSSK